MNRSSFRLAKPGPSKLALSLPAAALMAAACCSQAQAQFNLSFNATYDFGSLTAPQQANFVSTINSALSFYSSSLQTPTPVTVGILFKADESISLGQSTTYIGTESYADFRTKLVANAGSAVDAVALSFLPTGANNPANGSTQVTTSLPLLRALGFASGDNAAVGGVDSTVSLKTSIMNLDRIGAQNPSFYDLKQVVWHEVNEVLGFTSAISGSSQGAPAPTGAISAADLFRYRGIGVRSFSTSLSEVSYLSYDNGATKLAGYNQTAGGDFSDFDGNPPSVQDAFSTPGLQLDQGLAEKTALDIIGYNFTSVPEPGALGLAAAVTLIGFAAVRKLRVV